MKLRGFRLETQTGWLKVEETDNHDLVYFAIQDTNGDTAAECLLNKETFDELCGLGYDIKVNYPYLEPEDEV